MANSSLPKGFCVPPFMPSDPELWFKILEHTFDAAGITSESSRYYHLCANLDMQHAREIRDLICTPPETEPYTKSKVQLLKRLSILREIETRKMLEAQKLDDRQPSQFLKHLRDLAGSVVNEADVRSIWFSLLPISVKKILETQQDTSLDKSAELADAVVDLIHEIATAASSASTSTPVAGPTNQAVMQHVNSLRAEVAKLHRQVNECRSRERRSRRRSRSPPSQRRSRSGSQRSNRSASQRSDRSASQRSSRSASRASSRSSTRIMNLNDCLEHRRLGSKARVCRQPCDFLSRQRG